MANNNANGIPMLNEGNHDLGPAISDFTEESGMTTEILPPTVQPSLVSDDAQSLPRNETVGPVTRSRRLRAVPGRVVPHDMFYHSRNSQPMPLEQLIYGPDSDDEIDHVAADFEERMRLDAAIEIEGVDVSEVEKEFMLMWNSFVRKQSVNDDDVIPWACEKFSRVHKKKLTASSTLAVCWRVFMVKLWECGLLDPATMNKCNTYLENYRGNNSGSNNKNNVGNSSSSSSSSTGRSSKRGNRSSSTGNNNINMNVAQGDHKEVESRNK